MIISKYKYLVLAVVIILLGIMTANVPMFSAWKNDSDRVSFHKSWPWIEIVTDVSGEDYFPVQWSAFGVKPSADPIISSEHSRVMLILVEELGKYPKSLLKKNLQKIMLGSSLSIYNIEYGATNIDKHIYITSKGKQLGFSDEYLRKTIHHEFSSILIRNNDFPFDAWKKLSPETLGGQDGVIREVAAIKKGWEGNNHTKKDLADGFVSKYGRSSLENDINTYAENLMTSNDWLSSQAEDYSIIKEKVILIKEFYRGLGIAVL